LRKVCVLRSTRICIVAQHLANRFWTNSLGPT
jgi:hypothetical protein